METITTMGQYKSHTARLRATDAGIDHLPRFLFIANVILIDKIDINDKTKEAVVPR